MRELHISSIRLKNSCTDQVPISQKSTKQYGCLHNPCSIQFQWKISNGISVINTRSRYLLHGTACIRVQAFLTQDLWAKHVQISSQIHFCQKSTHVKHFIWTLLPAPICIRWSVLSNSQSSDSQKEKITKFSEDVSRPGFWENAELSWDIPSWFGYRLFADRPIGWALYSTIDSMSYPWAPQDLNQLDWRRFCHLSPINRQINKGRDDTFLHHKKTIRLSAAGTYRMKDNRWMLLLTAASCL